MSSADLTHVLTLSFNSFRLVIFTAFLQEGMQVKHLLFCLFPSFKERLSLPFEVTLWPVFQALVAAVATPCLIWECKGTNFIFLSKSWAKNFYSFSLLLFKTSCFRLKRDAKVIRLFRLSQQRQKIFF